jgi:ABC-type uncharacterized transport system permease subunit
MDPLFSTLTYYGFAAILVAFIGAIIYFGWTALSSLIGK